MRPGLARGDGQDGRADRQGGLQALRRPPPLSEREREPRGRGPALAHAQLLDREIAGGQDPHAHPRRAGVRPVEADPTLRGRRRSTRRASGSRTRSSASAWWLARPARGRSTSSSPSGSAGPGRRQDRLQPRPPGRAVRAVPVADSAARGVRDKLALPHAMSLPRVTLRKRLARAIRGGHPWIYRDALAGAPRLADGALVLVAGGDGRPLARGFWDATLADRRAGPRRRGRARRRRRDRPADRGGAGAAARRDRSSARPTPSAGFTARPTRSRACTPTSTAARSASATTAAARGPSTATCRGAFARAARAAGLPIDAIVERRPRGAEAAATNGPTGHRSARSPRARSRSARTASGSAPICAAARRGACFSTSATTARASGAGARSARAEPVRLHGRLLDLRRGRRRARDHHGRRRGAGHRGGAGATSSETTFRLDARRASPPRTPSPSSTRAAAAGERFDLVISDPPSFAPSRRALRDRPRRLPAAASPLRRGHRAGRHPLRRLLLEPRRAGGLRGHRARRRARGGTARRDRRDSRRRARPSGGAAISRGRLPQICGSESVTARAAAPAAETLAPTLSRRGRRSGRAAGLACLPLVDGAGAGAAAVGDLLRDRPRAPDPLDRAAAHAARRRHPILALDRLVLPAVLRGDVPDRDRRLPAQAPLQPHGGGGGDGDVPGRARAPVRGRRVPAPGAFPALPQPLVRLHGLGAAHRSPRQRLPFAARGAHLDAGVPPAARPAAARTRWRW